ncbi:MAG: NADPH:quinone reductase [Beijerinckiaceae bacterium]|jgi:NADPH:quinone reductase
MKAGFYERRGPAREVLQLGERPTPEPGPGEVRVKIAVSAVNPTDTKSRGNWLGATAMTFPLVIPHQDGAGVIDKVGPGVDETRLGERVWLYMAQRGRPFGTAAEYCCVPAERAVPLPLSADFAAGASLGIPAMTAHYALFASGPLTGKTVLVQGGAGAVGFYAVQLAKWGKAAHVIATVSRDAQAEKARLAGADTIVNYKTEDVVLRLRRLLEKETPVDLIVEVAFGANQTNDLALLAQNGVIAAYASDADPRPTLNFPGFLVKDATLRMLIIYEAPRTALDAAVRDINTLIEEGALKHQVATRYGLDEIASAHEGMESGKEIGKILIGVGE